MGRRKARVLKNGRNAGSTAFLMLDHYIFDCAAYRSMRPGPRALLDEMIRRHNGSNNGHIGLGQREAAKCLNVNKDTVPGYFDALIERGFIAPTRPGGFNMKNPESRRSTEWRLTWLKTDYMAATKDFIAWNRQKSTARKIGTVGPENPDTDRQCTPDCPKNPDLSTRFRRPIGPENPGTYTSSHSRGAFPGSAMPIPCRATWRAIRAGLHPLEAKTA